MNKQNEFFEKMISFFPTIEEKYWNMESEYGTILETIAIEDLIMPELIKALRSASNEKLLKSIFEYFEEVVVGENEHLRDMLSITVLESLGDDDEIRLAAQKYMGPKTYLMQIQADARLGRTGRCT